MDLEDRTNQITATFSAPVFHNQYLTVIGQESVPQQNSSAITSQSKSVNSRPEDTDLVITEDGLSNGTCEVETMVATRCTGGSRALPAEDDHNSLSNDGLSVFSNNDLSLPEVCISTNCNSFEDDMSYEVQQAHRIYSSFLLDKHKAITSLFLHPIGHQEAQHGIGGVRGRGQAQLKQSMCLRRMEEKFIHQEYENITEFVADFRLMLENCYRYHGVDHWISKQAQKLEIMLEQKLTLLSRMLREKTTLAVTSKGRFGAEDERSSGGTSTRRRLAPRSLATITVGGHESVMVQALRLEEQQRAKDEKRQRELEKKEAEEMSAKEVEDWEQTLLSQASPHTVDTLWELPAIGHFLCLTQTALNLPEIIFFELERCLLMPRCSLLLSKIMTSLLSPPQRRASLHRRPALPYRRWESELRQRVMGWYRAVGASHDQPGRAEQLGLCHQFFSVQGEVSPLEEKPFHLLPFYQRVWLLKGLCDHVYETQKDVQDALLSQPIHECRESILGYDSKENAYIHFPHFCGADLRIYCQSPSTPPAFPLPSVRVKKVEKQPGTEADVLDRIKDEEVNGTRGYCGGSVDTGESNDFGSGKTETFKVFKGEHLDGEEDKTPCTSWSFKEEDASESETSSCDDSKLDLKINTNLFSHSSSIGNVEKHLKEESVELEHQCKELQQELCFSTGLLQTTEADTQEPCLNVGEHSYTGRSPARLASQFSPNKLAEFKLEVGNPSRVCQKPPSLECCKSKTSNCKSKDLYCCCQGSGLAAQFSFESVQNLSDERMKDKISTKRKKLKKKRGREQLPKVKGEEEQLQHTGRMRLSTAEAANSALRKVATTIKRKDKKKKHKTGKKLDSSKKIKDEPPGVPSFKLVCTDLEELRELISKIEDELDDLESTKKRLGRWYYRREAVKELHGTLIRLLNELSPWEPKLVKAFQRNRLRLKKEFDDFKKHPEYNNFVREECISSSSSSDDDDEDDEESGLGTEVCSLSEHHRRSEDEDLENLVPRGLWSGASTRESVAESDGERVLTYVPPDDLSCTLDSREKGITVLPRLQTDSGNITSSEDSGPQSISDLIPSSLSRDSNSTWASEIHTHTSLSPKPPILHPTTGLPKGYTPIPTLLAKSVGNKVTLMKRPADYPRGSNIDRWTKGPLVSMPTSAPITTKLSKAQNCSSSVQQHTQGLQKSEVQGQPSMATVTAVPPKSLQAKPRQTVTKNSVQVKCKVPEGLGHLVGTEDRIPVESSVVHAGDQISGEKVMQQIVILPSKFHRTEEKTSSLHQQQFKGIQEPSSKVAGPLCMSTNVPGFTIPENKIPIQQVAPLKNVRILSSPSVSPHLQEEVINTAGFKGAQIWSPQPSITKSVLPNSPLSTNPSCAGSSEPSKSPDPKQELRTVCIRDSHSILVTTRGGNTGIVKVQTSSDHNALGSLPANPVITISPEFKAFLVSKSSQTPSSSAPSHSSCTIPVVTSIPVAGTEKQVSSVFKSSFPFTTPMPPTVTSSNPVIVPISHTASTTIALGQGSANSVAAKIAQHTKTTAAGSTFQPPLEKSTAVPTQSYLGASRVLTQAEFVGKTGVKRACTDETSQFSKFILFAPSSSSASNVALLKSSTSSTKSLPSSGVMFISQPAATLSTTSMGSIPTQAVATGVSGQLLTTSLSCPSLKLGSNPGQSVGGLKSETSSKVKSITLASGVQIQLSGRTATIGQKIGALSHSPTKSTPLSVSDTGCLTAITTELVPVLNSNTITSCSTQLVSHASLTSSQQMSIPSLNMIPLLGASTTSSTTLTTALTAGNDMKKNGMSPNKLPCRSAQVATVQISTGQSSTSTLTHQPSNISSSISKKSTVFSSSSHPVRNESQTSVSSAATTNTQFATSATGTVQQRVVINTSAPLAAGTQIVLNNARFVVPPQGLGPGSHVLIISSPMPQQVPTASTANTGALVPPKRASHDTIAPTAPVLPQLPLRLPSVPAVNGPFVACAPAVPSSLIVTAPDVKPFQHTGTPGLGSTAFPSKTNIVSALPMSQGGNFMSHTLVSSPPSVPALVSPLVTSVSAVNPALANKRLSAGAPVQAECSSAISPALARSLSRLSAPLSSLPMVASSAASVIAHTPSFHSLPSQEVHSVTTQSPVTASQQVTTGIAPASTGLLQGSVHPGLDNSSIKKMAPAVMQPLFSGTKMQVLPTLAVPPISGAVSKTQMLPIATVTPIGGVVKTFETAPVVTSPSNAVLVASAHPITSMKTNNAIHMPVLLTNQALGKHCLQTSSSGIRTDVASKLLISPDGAVLNTVRGHVNPTELTACAKLNEALAGSHNSSTGALHTRDTDLQAERKSTN